jgi:predicted transcriptional regulator
MDINIKEIRGYILDILSNKEFFLNPAEYDNVNVSITVLSKKVIDEVKLKFPDLDPFHIEDIMGYMKDEGLIKNNGTDSLRLTAKGVEAHSLWHACTTIF